MTGSGRSRTGLTSPGDAASGEHATAEMRAYIDGSAAIVMGALDAGCDFFAGYPITPVSPILMAMMPRAILWACGLRFR